MKRFDMRIGLIVMVGFFVGCQPGEPDERDLAFEGPASVPSISSKVRKKGRLVSIEALGAQLVEENDRVDILFYGKEKVESAVTLLENVLVMQKGPEIEQIKVLIMREEAELLTLGQQAGVLQVSLRNPDDLSATVRRTRVTLESLFSDHRLSNLKKKRLSTIQKNNAEAPSAELSADNVRQQPVSRRVGTDLRGMVLPLLGAQMARPGDRIDIIAALRFSESRAPVSVTLMSDLLVLASSGPDMQGKVCVQVLPVEAELLLIARHVGALFLALRNPEDFGGKEKYARTTIETLLTGERVKALKKKRANVIQVIRLPQGPGASLQSSMPSSTSQAGVECEKISEHYEDHGVNDWVDTVKDKLSTFAVDVDTGSYTIARRKLSEGLLPPFEAVRTEEFINYFRYDYPTPDQGDVPFAVALQVAPSPFVQDRHILRVGLKGIELDERERKPAHLTFLVDTSGSMHSADKIELVKRTLRFLVDQLQEGDTVALCTYAGSVSLLLSPTGMDRRAEIHQAIEELTAGGTTAMESGLELAYKLASENFRVDAVNRVIVCSDGDANVGATKHGDMLESIAHYAAAGITLSTVGFGMGNYKDHTMEQLADQGNGNYSYIDTYSHAKRVFGAQLMGTLQVIAKDVKIQVEFNPRTVSRYRLIGYENRDMADKDFRNDKVDAGEIGSGHTVTALYELELANPGGYLGQVRVRWKTPGATPEMRAEERDFDIQPEFTLDSFEDASTDFQKAIAVAALAENLRDSPSQKTWTMDIAVAIARRAAPEMREDERELITLIETARKLLAAKTEN